jgi:hypothetical protein
MEGRGGGEAQGIADPKKSKVVGLGSEKKFSRASVTDDGHAKQLPLVGKVDPKSKHAETILYVDSVHNLLKHCK